MVQTTSDKGLAFLASHEGIVPAPYLDSVGVMTYGIGHTAAAGAPDPRQMTRAMPEDIDAALADVMAVFRKDIAKYEAGVRKAFTAPLTQAQFDAAVSFHFNTGAIGRASWVKHFNAGNHAKAVKAIMNWTKPPEIKKRRQAERDLFAKGTYGNLKTTVWQTNGSTRVVWRPLRTLTRAQLLALMKAPQRPAEPQPAPTPPATPQKTATSPWAALLAALVAVLTGKRK